MGLASGGIVRQIGDTAQKNGDTFEVDGGPWYIICEQRTAGTFHAQARHAADASAAWWNITAALDSAGDRELLDIPPGVALRVRGDNGNARGEFRVIPARAGLGGPYAA